MIIICLKKISNINPKETLDPQVIDSKKNFIKKIFNFFEFYVVQKNIEKKISIVKNIIIVLIFFDRFDRQFTRNSLKNYFSDEPKLMINYILEILQTNTINNHFTDLTDYFYYKDCNILWKANISSNTNQKCKQSKLLATSQNEASEIINLNNNNNQNNFSCQNSALNNSKYISSQISKEIPDCSLLDISIHSVHETFKPNTEVEKINNLIYEKFYNSNSNIEISSSGFQANSYINSYSYWSTYNSDFSIVKGHPNEGLLDTLFDYKKIFEEFIAKVGEPKSYLSIYKHFIIKEVIVIIQIYFLGYEKIPKINIPYSTLINHFYRVVESSNTSIDFEILIVFTRIIKKYGEQITDEWSDIFKILNIIIRREENKNYDKFIKVLYEILDRIKLLIISQKFHGILEEYINFLDEFKSFPYDSLMILKCKYKLNSFLNYISKLESVIIENLIK